MNHHTQETTCPLCEEKLQGCDTEWKAIFPQLTLEFPDLHICWGFRNEEDQERMFDDGLTDAHWPDSEHNVMKDGKPCSRALDLFKLDDKGKAVFEKKYYLLIAQYLNKIGASVEWSGTWKKRKESDHFQLTEEKL